MNHRKSKPQYPLSNCYEWFQFLLKLLGKASISSLTGRHWSRTTLWVACSTLQFCSHRILLSLFPYSFRNPLSFCFPSPLFQIIIIWVREENTAPRKKILERGRGSLLSIWQSTIQHMHVRKLTTAGSKNPPKG